MITLILIFFALFAFFTDLHILRYHIPARKWLRRLYILQAVFIDFGILGCLSLMIIDPDFANSINIFMSRAMLIFMMSFCAKVIFAFFSIIQLIIKRIRKKRDAGKNRKYSFFPRLGFVMASVVLCVMIWGATIGHSKIRVERVTIESSYLPEEFDGFTIAQFSDTHLGNLRESNPLIENMVAEINRLKPDIVIQSGDLVNIYSDELNDMFIKQLSKIEPPVYAVLGNHDMGYYIRRPEVDPVEDVRKLVAKQQAMGWTMLQNENRHIYRNNDSIAICGVLYPEDKRVGIVSNGYEKSNLRKTFEGVKDSTFSILISHTPALFDSVPSLVKPNLTVSGHVHAMQAKITIGDWKWSPAKWMYPMWSGLWIDRGRYLYVNDGIGHVLYPMRIGTRPEITLYELKTRKNN